MKSKTGFRKRWRYTRDGVTYYVYAERRPRIKGIRRAGAYDRARNILVGDDLCDYANPAQFLDWRMST